LNFERAPADIGENFFLEKSAGKAERKLSAALATVLFLLLSGTRAQAQEAAEPAASAVELEFGDVSYKSVPTSEILGKAGLEHPAVSFGFTSAKFRNSSSVELAPEARADGCFSVTRVGIRLGYSFEILIDEKYKPGSCEYEAAVKHELEHVRIYREELEYYGKLIEEELLISSLNMSEICALGLERRGFKEAAKAVIKDDERVNLLLARLDESVREKNASYDSEAEYLRVRSECREW
jgi:hypothetical protein